MLSLQDCLDFADMTESELAAIATHEHIPPIVALELGNQLLRTPQGLKKLRQFIVDDIAAAQARQCCHECERFSRSLAEYLKDHPEAQDTDPCSHVAMLAKWTPISYPSCYGLCGSAGQTSLSFACFATKESQGFPSSSS